MSHEVVLMKEMFQADTLQEVVDKTMGDGMHFDSLESDPVINRETNPPTTTQTPIIYLEAPNALIMQGPQDNKYRMFEYRWIE